MIIPVKNKDGELVIKDGFVQISDEGMRVSMYEVSTELQVNLGDLIFNTENRKLEKYKNQEDYLKIVKKVDDEDILDAALKYNNRMRKHLGLAYVKKIGKTSYFVNIEEGLSRIQKKMAIESVIDKITKLI